MDRTESFNDSFGPLGEEVSAALYRAKATPEVVNYVYGLGGRDVQVQDMEKIYAELERIANGGEVGKAYRYLGVRG